MDVPEPGPPAGGLQSGLAEPGPPAGGLLGPPAGGLLGGLAEPGPPAGGLLGPPARGLQVTVSPLAPCPQPGGQGIDPMLSICF